MRILLIEDDSFVAQSIELMLKSKIFNVYTTDRGEEGIDLGILYDYDIILLDLNLPDMSGFEVLRSLRVSKVKTPILILSGVASIEHKVKGLGYGADDYMTKPFHKSELIARVHAIVGRSRGHARSRRVARTTLRPYGDGGTSCVSRKRSRRRCLHEIQSGAAHALSRGTP
jgi:two-component system cell cycle response regulator CtrA